MTDPDVPHTFIKSNPASPDQWHCAVCLRIATHPIHVRPPMTEPDVPVLHDPGDRCECCGAPFSPIRAAIEAAVGSEPDVPSGQHRFEPDPYDVADRNPDPACRVCGNGAESPEHDEGAHACVSRLTRCGVCGLGPEPDVPSGERDEAQEIAERALGSGPTDDDTLALAQSIRAYGERQHEQGVKDVLRIRCAQHFMVPQYNTAEIRGAECATCAVEEAKARTIAEWDGPANLLRARAERAEADLAYAKGAMAAQDEREQRAGEACGVPYEEHGCDWPDAVAEHLVSLRADLAATKQELSDYRMAADVEAKHADELQADLAEARERIGRLEEALRPLVALDNGDRVQLWDFADLFEAGRAALAEPEEPKA